MKPDDLTAEAVALEFEIRGLQAALQKGVHVQIATHTVKKGLPPLEFPRTPARDAYAAAAADPVSLRAGVGAATADHGALVALLVALDVIKLEDYQRARVDMLRQEVAAYEKVLTERLGQAVPLAVKPETGKGETDDV